MPATLVFNDQLLGLIFNAVPISKLADNAVTTPLTSLYMSLHTVDPGNSGDQTIGEVAYSGYARVPVTRDNTGWQILAGNVYLVGVTLFPAPVSQPTTTQVAVQFGIGEAVSGAGRLYYKGPLAPPINIIVNVPPRIDNQPMPSQMSPGWD